MRKPAFCICENKDADQLCYRDSTIPLLSKSEISSFKPSSVAVQPGLYRTCSKTLKTGFLRTRLILLISAKNEDCGYLLLVSLSQSVTDSISYKFAAW